MIRVLFLSFCTLLLGSVVGCATQPRFETTGVMAGLSPQVAGRDSTKQGAEVLWGGVIVNSSNLADATQLEVLAYPLDDRQQPEIDRRPIGRFLAVAPGYLETVDYAQGRLITIRGRVRDTAVGKIGDASYNYPVIDILDSQLWKRDRYVQPAQPRVNFGIGVMIGR
ncbi:MAG TPA: Slp family lipoprotein [Gammaproteobacteria bacterium]|nr:Slp family lipoprotein [Gammaproteobacteria bacterium]